jgi:hypothetical protein
MKAGRNRFKKVMLAATAAVLGAAPAADAGEYQVYSCKTKTGAVAPTDGWTSEQSGGLFSSPANNCASGGALLAQLNGDHAQSVGSRITWHWTAAANTQLRGVTIWRSSSSTLGSDNNATPGEYISWPSAGFGGDARDYCIGAWNCTFQGGHGTWNAVGNSVTFNATDLNGTNDIYASAFCGGTAGFSCADRNSATPMSDMRVHAMQATLEDVTDPTPTGAGGTLTQPGTHKGVQSITFNAVDTGSGIYRGIVEVKKQGETNFSPIYSQVIDSNGGKCADAGADSGTIYEFLYRVPCKLSTGAQVDFDTATVADGTHELRVRVEDASGNRATVYGPASFEVDNVPPPSTVDPDADGPLTGEPTIAGAPKVGNTLVGDKGSWSGQGNTYSGAWLRCVSAADLDGCTPIPTVVGQELELTNADLGYYIRYQVTASNAEGSTVARSAPKGPVTTSAGTVPQCADAADNDADSKVDDADPGCTDRADDSENSDAATGGGGTGGGGSTGDHASGGIVVPGPAQDASKTGGPILGPPNNGINASNHAKITLSGTRRRTVKFGRRIATVATLRDENGRPIVGATVTVLERMSTPGSDWVPARAPLVTDAAGKMRWLIPAKFSRTIRYAYKANLANTDFQSTADVVLTVFSKTTIKPSKRFLRNGQTLRFNGRLLSRPVPRGGVLIDLQAKVGRRWQTFKTTRTRGNGRWTTSYTFRATRGLQTYAFRARVRQDTGFPYAISKSRTLRIKVAG